MSTVVHELMGFLERTRRRPIVVASHPRSGTHLLIDALRLNFPQCRPSKRLAERMDHLYINIDELEQMSVDVVLEIAGRSPRPIFKTHALPDFSDRLFRDRNGYYASELPAWLANHADTLYTYRDGRDALDSLRRLLSKEEDSARVALGAFMRQVVDGASRAKLWQQHVEGWLANPKVFCIAMEKLMVMPDAILSDISARFGLESDQTNRILPEPPKSLWNQRLSRLLDRTPQSTAILGPAGPNWRQQLSASDRAFFNDETDNLLVKLGYEKSDAWVNPQEDSFKTPRLG